MRKLTVLILFLLTLTSLDLKADNHSAFFLNVETPTVFYFLPTVAAGFSAEISPRITLGFKAGSTVLLMFFMSTVSYNKDAGMAAVTGEYFYPSPHYYFELVFNCWVDKEFYLGLNPGYRYIQAFKSLYDRTGPDIISEGNYYKFGSSQLYINLHGGVKLTDFIHLEGGYIIPLLNKDRWTYRMRLESSVSFSYDYNQGKQDFIDKTGLWQKVSKIYLALSFRFR